MTDPADPLHIHVENRRAQPAVYQATPERMAAAVARHADLGVPVTFSVSCDLDSFDAEIGRADVLVLPTPILPDWRPRLYALKETAPRLKLVFQTGAGAERLMPLDWAPPGVPVTNNSGAHVEMAGQYVAMALLLLNNRIPVAATAKPERRWDRKFGTSLRGKTVLFVGFGSLAEAGAVHARHFGLRVLGVRRSGAAHPLCDEMAKPDGLHALLPQADFVFVTAPLTPETRGMIGTAELALMKPGAGFMNMGRAEIVDYQALDAALRAGRVAGAVLDVFNPEPLPPDSFLWGTPNLIITPHVGADDDALYIPNSLDVLFENLRSLRAGQPLRNVLDPALGY
jgi:phosphoglycerate dehydrogenase-like enzyme